MRLVPKLVAIQRSEATALAAAIPLRAIYLTFFPFLWLLERASGVILRSVGMSPDAGSVEGRFSEDEILAILAASATRSSRGRALAELLERVMRFSQRATRHSMVPRVDIVSLPIETTGERAQAFVRTHQYSRMPLTRGRSLDEVAGYLYAKDFLLHPDPSSLTDLTPLRRDVLFVPAVQSGVDALREDAAQADPDRRGGRRVRRDERPRDDGGSPRGDRRRDQGRARRRAAAGRHRAGRAGHVGGGRTRLDGRARAIGVETQDVTALSETIGARVVDVLGRLPRVGDKVDMGRGAAAEVIAISRRRVTRLRVSVKKDAGGAEPSGASVPG